MRIAWTHLLYETEDGPGDTVGLIRSPEDKVQGGFTYSVGPWMFSWEANFLSSMVPNLNPASEQHFELGTYTLHDVRLGWDVSESANIFFGADNVFDEDAPLVLSGITGNTTGFSTDASLYDPIGRTWFAGVRLRY